MNLRQLEYLVAALRHGSLSRAAAALGVSQPALSKGVAGLESRVGVVLLRRTGRGVVATAAGLAAARRGAALLEEAGRFSVEPEPASSVAAGRGAREMVRIGCGPSEATRLLPMAIESLRERHPAWRVTVLYGLNEDLMPMVKRGEIDFALSSVPRTATDPGLRHKVLYRDRAAVVCSGRHPLASLRRVSPQMLLRYPWVLARRRELERRALDDLFLGAGLRPPDAAVETTSATLMKSLLMEGEHLSFLPREMIHWEQQAGQLVCIAVENDAWERQVGITQRRGARTPRGAGLLIDRIAAAARSMFGALPSSRSVRPS